jgi:hypothetical protein
MMASGSPPRVPEMVHYTLSAQLIECQCSCRWAIILYDHGSRELKPASRQAGGVAVS